MKSKGLFVNLILTMQGFMCFNRCRKKLAEGKILCQLEKQKNNTM